jgi:hypothetical protein
MKSPAELILRPRPLKQVFRAIFGGLAAVAGVGGMSKVPSSDLAGRLFLGCVSLIFAFGALALLVGLIPGASFLRLTENGFTIRNLFRETFYRWSDVRGFSVQEIHGHSVVGFEFTDEYRPHRARRIRRRIRHGLIGVDAVVPDNLGLSCSQLARLLNDWKSGHRRFFDS